jgi:hypothetical protein
MMAVRRVSQKHLIVSPDLMESEDQLTALALEKDSLKKPRRLGRARKACRANIAGSRLQMSQGDRTPESEITLTRRAAAGTIRRKMSVMLAEPAIVLRVRVLQRNSSLRRNLRLR